MAGVFIALIISWLLLYLTKKKHLLALGAFPLHKRLLQFVLGFLFSAILCTGSQYLELQLKSAQWITNDKYSPDLILSMFRWDFVSVLTEELIFRGALLYILIRKIGSQKGMLISAMAFGIYHWFTFGIFGNLIPMFFVFTGTGIMGYAWAMAFYKTKSIFLPLGMHLGWNFTFNTIFSRGPLGQGLFKVTGGNPISHWFSLIDLWLVPIIILLIVHYLVQNENINKKEHKPEATFS